MKYTAQNLPIPPAFPRLNAKETFVPLAVLLTVYLFVWFAGRQLAKIEREWSKRDRDRGGDWGL